MAVTPHVEISNGVVRVGTRFFDMDLDEPPNTSSERLIDALMEDTPAEQLESAVFAGVLKAGLILLVIGAILFILL
jgi:hypothetical protein